MTRLALPTVILIIGAASSALAAPVSSPLPSTRALQNCVPPEHTQAGSQACVATSVIRLREFRTTELAISESSDQTNDPGHDLSVYDEPHVSSRDGRVTLAKRAGALYTLTEGEQQAVVRSRSQRPGYYKGHLQRARPWAHNDALGMRFTDNQYLDAQDWEVVENYRQIQARLEEELARARRKANPKDAHQGEEDTGGQTHHEEEKLKEAKLTSDRILDKLGRWDFLDQE
ncbi:hypothetical protein F5878DRAFT_647019 [Lentinula raphanica]|uniref:Uncharacterized protein n=1 Tax=Lentinula raphanica TaxID=153919 RepID=A0AA38NWX7_9AGAR|nr:hypothetical protein F5878DRAFT_647019 [Lentinula raphanica]